MKFIKFQSLIKSSELIKKKYSLSPWLYSYVPTPNKSKKLNDYLSEELTTKFLGKEIQRKSYIKKSSHYYLVTRAMSEKKFTLYKYNQSEIPMLPSKFKNLNLKENDILIAKDAKPGEVTILDKDYPNHMVSGGIYKLPLKEDDKLFLFPILKSKFFKDQLNVLVPKGATLKHAGKLFLDCKIPFFNNEEIKYLKKITEVIKNFEILIEKRILNISKEIEDEIFLKTKFFKRAIKISDLKNNTRLDTGTYSEEYVKIISAIKNYQDGFYCLNQNDLKIGSTPKKRVKKEGKNLKFRWLSPDYINDFGFIEKNFSINCNKSNINRDSLLITNRTSKGGLGEYVGISTYYDVKKNGLARCNQGFYIYDKSDKNELKFLAAFFNSKLIRTLCGKLSLGAKMKELKSKHISNIPIPKFNIKIKDKIINYYSNSNAELELKNIDIKKNNIEKFSKEAGILELATAIEKFNIEIDKIIEEKILNERSD